MTILTAHAGCEGTKIGTWEALNAALQSGCDSIEIDLQFADGRIVFAHDPVLAGQSANLISFDEILAWVRPHNVLLGLDIKTAATFQPVLQKIRESGLEHRTIFSGSTLRSSYSDGNFRICANVEGFGFSDSKEILSSARIQQIVERYKQIAAPCYAGINIDYHRIDEAGVAQFQDAGVAVWLWTVDDLYAVERFLRVGVTGISTNQIYRTIALRESLARCDSGLIF